MLSRAICKPHLTKLQYLMNQEFDYVIIGGGTHGLSSTFFLSQQEKNIAIFQQFYFGHQLGSSHGPSRILRSTYWDQLYAELTKLSIKEYWPKMQQTLGKKLIHPNPYLLFNQVDQVYESYKQHSKQESGFSHLTPKQVCQRFPSFPLVNTHLKAIYDPNAFVIASQDYSAGLTSYLKKKSNVKIYENSKVISIQEKEGKIIIKTQNKVVLAKKIVIACGRWVSELLPSITKITKPVRQIIFYLQLKNNEKYQIGNFPSFSHRRVKNRYYCVPSFRGSGVKLARHISRQEELKGQQQRNKEILDLAKEYFGENLIGIRKYEECWYTNTKKEDFIIDWVDPGNDRVLVCSCCSGHSFKMSPIIGKIVRDFVIDGKSIDFVEKEGYKFKIPYHQGINLE